MSEVLQDPARASSATAAAAATVLSIANLPGSHEGKVAYTEMLRGAELSVGVYSLPAGAFDPQTPHEEDELYFVREGYGILRVGATDHEVAPGVMVYVPATVPHRFHSIRQSIVALVIFAPPEGSRVPAPGPSDGAPVTASLLVR